MAASDHSSDPSRARPAGIREINAKRVTLLKEGQRWTFTCAVGEEATLLARVNELALAADCPLDRFDAAIIGRQLQPDGPQSPTNV